MRILSIGSTVAALAALIALNDPSAAWAREAGFAPSVGAESATELSAQRRAYVGRRGGAAVGRRGAVAVGPRGGVAVRRGGAVVVRPGVRRGVVVARPVRPWVRRPYYGAIIGGVALGTILTAAAVATVPPAPAPNLCWYWVNAAQTQGYWDYCQ